MTDITASDAGRAAAAGPLSVRRIPEADWPAISQRFGDLSFEQSLTYGRAAAARIGARLHCLVLERDGQLVAAAQIRLKTLPGFGRGIAWIASGPLLQRRDAPAPDADLIAAVLAALRAELALRQGHVLRLRLPGIALHALPKIDALAAAAG